MKREVAETLLAKIEQEGSGELEGKWAVEILDQEQFSLTYKGETEVVDRETVVKRLAQYPQGILEEVKFGSDGHQVKFSRVVDRSWKDREDERRKAAGVIQPGQRTYTVWAYPESGEPKPLRTLTGTRADGFVAVLLEQGAFEVQPQVALKSGNPEESKAKRPTVVANPGGFQEIEPGFLESSALYPELEDLRKKQASAQPESNVVELRPEQEEAEAQEEPQEEAEGEPEEAPETQEEPEEEAPEQEDTDTQE